MPADFKVPKTWVKICATKKVNRFRPPEVAAAVAEKERSAERLQVCCCLRSCMASIENRCACVWLAKNKLARHPNALRVESGWGAVVS